MILSLLLSGLVACGASAGAGALGGAGIEAQSPSFRAGAFELMLSDPDKGSSVCASTVGTRFRWPA